MYCKILDEYKKNGTSLIQELDLLLLLQHLRPKVLSKIHPLPKSVVRIHDPRVLSYLTQLRVGLSKLNFHKFKHNLRDT